MMKFLGTIDLSENSTSVLTLKKEQLIRDWETGILSDTAYVYLILRYQYQNHWKARLNSDGIGNAIVLDDADIEYLIVEWQGTGQTKKTFLPRKAIVAALQKIAEATRSHLGFEQLTIPSCDDLLGLAPLPLLESQQ